MNLSSIRTSAITLYHEFSSPLFDIIEPTYNLQTNLDSTSRKSYRHQFSLQEIRNASPCLDSTTFSYSWTAPIKLTLMGGVIAITVMDVLADPSVWWLAYFSNWGWSLVVLYFIASFACGVKAMWRGCGDIGFIEKSAWALLALSLPTQVLQSLMYYTYEFDGTYNIFAILKHGPFIPLLLLDGCVINRIPLRMKQFWLFQFVVVAYLAWSVTYTYTGLNLPDDLPSIYVWLDWKNSMHSAILLALFVLILLDPAIFLMCRSVSRMLPRRLRDENKEVVKKATTVESAEDVDITHDISRDIEEGGVTSCDEVVFDNVDMDEPKEEQVMCSIPKNDEATNNVVPEVVTERDEEIEDLTSFPSIIYDDGDASTFNSSIQETEASSRVSSRIDAYIETKKPYEDLASFAGYDEGEDTDYSFDKEGVDISFERDVSRGSHDFDNVSFPDLLSPVKEADM